MSLKNNKPIIFTSELYWSGDKTGVVGSSSLKSFAVSTSPEFGGPEGEWSAEHLFLSSIISCFMSTYLSFVNKMKIGNTGFVCTATGQVELIDGKYKFTYIHIYPKHLWAMMLMWKEQKWQWKKQKNIVLFLILLTPRSYNILKS